MSRRVSSVLYTLLIVVGGTGGLEWPETFQSLHPRLTISRYGHVEVESPRIVLAIAAIGLVLTRTHFHRTK